MASERWWSRLSPLESVSAVVLAGSVALPLALVGLSTVTGWDVARGSAVEEYWFGLGLVAVGSFFSAPYGAALGVGTLPIAARTATGYGTPTLSTGFDGPRGHVAGALLYAGLASFAAGAALWTVVRLPSGPTVQWLGSAAVTAVFLAGGLFVAVTFLAAQVHRRRGHDGTVDAGTVAGYALHAAGLLPAPLATLVVLDWLLPLGLLDAVVYSPW